MKGTMQIKRLKKKAAYYYVRDYDEKYGGDCIFFIEPFFGSTDKSFYYVRKLENGKIEIEGELHITTEPYLNSLKRGAKARLGECTPAYYWLAERRRLVEKTYY